MSLKRSIDKVEHAIDNKPSKKIHSTGLEIRKSETIIDEVKVYESISFLTGMFGQRIVRTVKMDGAKKYIFYVTDGICPRGLCEHSIGEKENGSFVVERRHHEVLSIRANCFGKACQKELGFWYSFVLNNRGIARKYKGNDEKKKKDKDLNKKETASLIELFELLFENNVIVEEAVCNLGNLNPGLTVSKYQAQYLREYNFTSICNTIAIKSETGTGKSCSTQKMLMAGIIDGTFKSVLIILSRQSLVQGTGASLRRFCEKDSFEHMGKSYQLPEESPFQNYMDLSGPKQYAEARFLICTPDSLHNLVQNMVVPLFDAVWMDESESAISYMTNSTTLNGKRRTCWRNCTAIIEDCKYFVASDADCSELTLKYVHDLRDVEKTLLIHNTKKTNTKKYSFVHSFDRGLQKLRSFIERKKKIYIPCDTKAQCMFIAHVLKEDGHLVVENIQKNGHEQKPTGKYKVLMYTGESSLMHKKSIKEYDALWKDYDIVLTTPVIDYGLDVNGAHFDIVVAFFTGHSLNYKGCSQMMERVRKPKDGRVIVVLSSFNAPRKILTEEEYQNIINMHKIQNHLDLEFSTGMTSDIVECLDTVRVVCEDGVSRFVVQANLYAQCFVSADYINHMSQHQFMQKLIERITHSGGKVTLPGPRWHVDHLVDAETLSRNKILARQLKSESEYLYAVTVFESIDLDDEMAEKKSGIYNNPVITAQLEKHAIKKLYQIQKPSFELIKKHGHPKQRDMFRNFIENSKR